MITVKVNSKNGFIDRSNLGFETDDINIFSEKLKDLSNNLGLPFSDTETKNLFNGGGFIGEKKDIYSISILKKIKQAVKKEVEEVKEAVKEDKPIAAVKEALKNGSLRNDLKAIFEEKIIEIEDLEEILELAIFAFKLYKNAKR